MRRLRREVLALVLSVGFVLIGVLAIAAGSGAGRSGLVRGMYTEQNVVRAVNRFRYHAGSDVKLLDLTITARTAIFTYDSGRTGSSYAVNIPGTRRSIGPTLVLGGMAYALSAIHAEVPAGLLAAIRDKPGLGLFVPDVLELAGKAAGTPTWTILGRTNARYLIFTANARGGGLSKVCSQPLPEGPDRPLGC